MAKFSKDKGTRGERDFVTRLNKFGVTARRVPLSGAMAGYKNDIIMDWLGGEVDGEVKLRADGFKEMYKWIKPVKVLFIKANRQEGLAVIRLKDFAELLCWANRATDLVDRQPIPEAIQNGYMPSLLSIRPNVLRNGTLAN